MYTRDFGTSDKDAERVPPGYSGSAFFPEEEARPEREETREKQEESAPVAAYPKERGGGSLLTRCGGWLRQLRWREMLSVDTLVLVAAVYLLLDDRQDEDLLLILLLCFFMK